jgi:hypothetical protein
MKKNKSHSSSQIFDPCYPQCSLLSVMFFLIRNSSSVVVVLSLQAKPVQVGQKTENIRIPELSTSPSALPAHRSDSEGGFRHILRKIITMKKSRRNTALFDVPHNRACPVSVDQRET